MRTQEVFGKLQAAKVKSQFDNFPGEKVIVGIINFRNRIEMLEGIPGFEADVAYFKSTIVFNTSSSRVETTSKEWNEIRGRAWNMQFRLIGLSDYLEEILRSQNTDSVFIKLPETRNFAEAIEYQLRFEKALNQLVLNPTIGGKVELAAWERGSLWFEIFLGGIAGVSVVGSAAWAAVVIYKKLLEVRLHAEYVRSLKLKNESLEDLSNANEQLLRMTLEIEAKAIADKNFNGGATPEQLERIKFAIKEFSELIAKGAEIHPALQAPENVSNLFPNMRNLLSINSRVQMIEGKPT